MLVLELAPKGPLNSFLKNNKWVNVAELYMYMYLMTSNNSLYFSLDKALILVIHTYLDEFRA